MAANGDIFTWGLSLGYTSAEAADAAAWGLPDVDRGIAGEAVDVAAGEGHIAAASLTGDTYAWGHNHHGQCADEPGNTCVLSPTRAGAGLEDVVVRRVACGKYHSA